MKKTLALLLALCMAFSMFSVSAFATAEVTYNVALVDENGEAVTEVEAGESVWAVISVDNYADYVGDSNVDWDADDIALASEYNKNIAVITTFIELDATAFTVATESGRIVWDSPYKTDIADQGGSMQYNLDGNVLKTLLQTDSEGGVYYAITKSELDANNGELFRVKLTTKATASGAYTLALNGGSEVATPGFATITSAAGDANITVDDVAVALGAAANLQVNGGEITEPEEPETPDVPEEPAVFGTLVEFGASKAPVAEDWTVTGAGSVINFDSIYLNDSSNSYTTATYNSKFDLTRGFTATYVVGGRYYQNYAAGNTYHGLAVGNITVGPEVLDSNHSAVVLKIRINDTVVATSGNIFDSTSSGWDSTKTNKSNIGTFLGGFAVNEMTVSYDPATKTITYGYGDNVVT